MIILSILILILIIIIIMSWVLSNLILKPKVISYDKLFDRETQNGRLVKDLYDEWDKEEFNITSQFGYLISCMLINNDISKKQFEDPKGKKKIAILVHGYTCGKYSSMIYVKYFLNRGITVLAYDHRNHGLSGKAHTSMGYYEKFDLQSVIDWCYIQYDGNVSVITHGESMGAATVLSHLAIDGRSHLVIADCGYSDLKELTSYQIKRFHHLPKFPFIPLASLIIRIRAGFRLEDVSPKDSILISDKPILFIHGLEDDFVPYAMSQEMYDLKEANKELYLVPEARHGESALVNPDGYEEKLNEFLDRYFF